MIRSGVLAGWLDDQNRLTEIGYVETHKRGGAAFAAAEILLKGPEARLPNGRFFHDGLIERAHLVNASRQGCITRCTRQTGA